MKGKYEAVVPNRGLRVAIPVCLAVVCIFLAVFASLRVVQARTEATAPVGLGTAASPYIIETPQQLALVAEQVNAGTFTAGVCYQLAVKLDMGGVAIVPIGTWEHPFEGTFEGGGLPIYGLRVDASTEGFAGLFGCLGEEAQVLDVVLENAEISGGTVGGVAGYSAGLIQDCLVRGGTLTAAVQAGGLVGYNAGEVLRCENESAILLALPHEPAPEEPADPVTGENEPDTGFLAVPGAAGGIAAVSSGAIAQCANRGEISGASLAGGLTAVVEDGSVTDSYSAAALEGDSVSGGIHTLLSGTADNCWFDSQLCPGLAEDPARPMDGAGMRTHDFVLALNRDGHADPNAPAAGEGETPGEPLSPEIVPPMVEEGEPEDIPPEPVPLGSGPEAETGAEAETPSVPVEPGPSEDQPPADQMPPPEEDGIPAEPAPTDAPQSTEDPAPEESGAPVQTEDSTYQPAPGLPELPFFLPCELDSPFYQAEEDGYPTLHYAWEEGVEILWPLELKSWTAAARAPAQGTGTAADPYRISAPEELAWLAVLCAGGGDSSGLCTELTADIDLSAAPWTPIGGPETPFLGMLNGAGHTVNGLTIDTDAPCQGLFGVVGAEGQVSYLKLNGAVTGGEQTAAVAGKSLGTITGCETWVQVSGGSRVGGVAGENLGLIEYCAAYGTVTGADLTGGLAGNNGGELRFSYATAPVSAAGMAGGLTAENGGVVANSYFAGTVRGEPGGPVCAGGEGGLETVFYCTDYCPQGGLGEGRTLEEMRSVEFLAELNGKTPPEEDALPPEEDVFPPEGEDQPESEAPPPEG